MEMLKVTVRESEWGYGDSDTSALFNPTTGKMCCLGFACEAAGMLKHEFVSEGTPGHLGKSLPPQLSALVDGNNNSDVCLRLMSINDAWKMVTIDGNDIYVENLDDRKAALIKHGLEAGIEFTFVP